MNDVCLECDCPATITTPEGDWLCLYHFTVGPGCGTPCPNCVRCYTCNGATVVQLERQSWAGGTLTLSYLTRPCPSCSSLDVTPAGLPVAADDDRPSDADAAAPPAASAPISPVVGLLPPESTTGDPTLSDMLQALTWCVTRAYDGDAPRGVIEAADRGLTVFGRIVQAVTA